MRDLTHKEPYQMARNQHIGSKGSAEPARMIWLVIHRSESTGNRPCDCTRPYYTDPVGLAFKLAARDGSTIVPGRGEYSNPITVPVKASREIT